MKRWLQRVWRDERGQSLLTQAMFLIPVLILVIGLTYDLGAVAVAQVRLQDCVDLAAQDAVKNIDYGWFFTYQDISLTPAALDVARDRLAQYSGGQAQLTGLSVEYTAQYMMLRLRAETRVPMRFLRLAGITAVTRRAEALALPAFGIEGAGQ